MLEQDKAFHSQTAWAETPFTHTSLFVKEYGNALGFSEPETDYMIGALRRFNGIVEDLGIPSPRTFLITDQPHPSGEGNTIRIIAQGLKEDVQESLAGKDPEQALVYIDQCLAMQARVWEAGQPISLDPPLSNFCRDSGDKLYYVDNFPPRQRWDDGSYLSEWPMPPEDVRAFIEARYFSPLQAQVIYAQILRALAQEEINIPPQLIKERIRGWLGEEAYNHIHLPPEARHEILEQAFPESTDLLRILAGEAFFEGKINKEDLKTIGRLTHIKIGGILPPQENINQVVEFLKDFP